MLSKETIDVSPAPSELLRPIQSLFAAAEARVARSRDSQVSLERVMEELCERMRDAGMLT